MRSVLGPRQVGKTTLAKAKLNDEASTAFYYLWDLRSVRNRYKDNELFFTTETPPGGTGLWICFDEIHKMPRWKNMLKGIYDATGELHFFSSSRDLPSPLSFDAPATAWPDDIRHSIFCHLP